MAALLLTIELCKRRKLPKPIAATVDHGLRKSSNAEASRVQGWVRKLGVEHHILPLTWDAAPPQANIHAIAREARYEQIGRWARSKAVKTLITGHTLDDQAETFLIRLARGSGVDGLSGMAPVSRLPVAGFDDLTLMRPLLGFSHERLIATLRAAKQDWIEDPSNDAVRFERARLRAARPVLEQLGLSNERLAETGATMRRAREALDTYVDALFASAVDVSEWGYAVVRAREFGNAPTEIGLRVLARLLTLVGGETYPPRFDALQAAHAWLISGDAGPKGRTLGGCRAVRREDGSVLVAREASAIGADIVLNPCGPAIWDGRFRVAVSDAAPEPAVVRALGAKGLAIAGPGIRLPSLEPRLIAATTPALWTGGQLVAAPLCKYFAAGAEEFGFSATFLGLAKGKGAAKGNSL